MHNKYISYFSTFTLIKIKFHFIILGVNCEENLDECLSNPCQNGGTCDDRENGYVCYCVAGYAGVHCEVDVAVCNTGNHCMFLLIKYLT